ncbi:MAG TPA: LLM class flavin-dependent oxidoreductase [Propionibacteriaceae bacterium]|nr:LLM class flavin-dependent oxidoreductase [Propionibacteriaceae bacterium]
MTALGVAFVPTLPPERLRSLATAVEAAGLDELWVWEDCFKQSGVASAAAALAWTERITVGIGILPVPLRNAAVCAMEIANLERMFAGRLIAGLGHGVQIWMGQVGAKAASPLTLLEEYATAVRRLLNGERVSVQGRYVQLDEVALDWPPSPPPPLMLGGEGPKSLALAARLGDGNVLAGALTEEEIRSACALISEHRTTDRHPVVATVIAATGPDAEARLVAERPRWFRPADAPIGVAGDAATIAAAIQRLASFGATSVCIQVTEDEPDLEGFVHFLGSEVKPLL